MEDTTIGQAAQTPTVTLAVVIFTAAVLVTTIVTGAQGGFVSGFTRVGGGILGPLLLFMPWTDFQAGGG